MAIPTYGAAPLATTFLILRGLQLVSFVGIIGVTANFVQEIVAFGAQPPHEIVGTLVVTSTAALYTLLSLPFFLSPANTGLFIMTFLDFLLLIAFTIVAVVLGKPLSYLNCLAIDSTSAAQTSSSALAFTQSLTTNVEQAAHGGFVVWVGATRPNCFESKTVWGLTVGLAILFTCSVFLLPALWAKQKRATVNAAKAAAAKAAA